MQEFFAKASAPKPVAPRVENPVQQTIPKAALTSEPTPYTTLEDFFGKPEQRGDDSWSDFVTLMTTQSEEMLKEQKAWEPYLEKMQPYQHPSTRREDLFWNKTGGANPNIGWKCHLNIAPENVVRVSSILKTLDLEHKYLLADVSDGKVFTVYLGSKQIVEAVMPHLYGELKDYLLEPKAPGEIAFAPGIVGRFSGSKDRFSTKAAYNGITLLSEDDAKISNPSEAPSAWKRADQEMRKLYGDYYGGINLKEQKGLLAKEIARITDNSIALLRQDKYAEAINNLVQGDIVNIARQMNWQVPDTEAMVYSFPAEFDVTNNLETYYFLKSVVSSCRTSNVGQFVQGEKHISLGYIRELINHDFYDNPRTPDGLRLPDALIQRFAKENSLAVIEEWLHVRQLEEARFLSKKMESIQFSNALTNDLLVEEDVARYLVENGVNIKGTGFEKRYEGVRLNL